ncbi:unnamed protein product [Symbiodinium sp. CCMP2456]|nr:unnamed protein product [Symbiodinium sp. CCMP2456]
MAVDAAAVEEAAPEEAGTAVPEETTEAVAVEQQSSMQEESAEAAAVEQQSSMQEEADEAAGVEQQSLMQEEGAEADAAKDPEQPPLPNLLQSLKVLAAARYFRQKTWKYTGRQCSRKVGF